MILPPSEAEHRFCPFAKTWSSRDTNNAGEFALCVTYDCMAWRWSKDHKLADGRMINVGYCGAAGAPTETEPYEEEEDE